MQRCLPHLVSLLVAVSGVARLGKSSFATCDSAPPHAWILQLRTSHHCCCRGDTCEAPSRQCGSSALAAVSNQCPKDDGKSDSSRLSWYAHNMRLNTCSKTFKRALVVDAAQVCQEGNRVFIPEIVVVAPKTRMLRDAHFES